MTKHCFAWIFIVLVCLSCKKEKFEDRIEYKETVFEFTNNMEFDFPKITFIELYIPLELPGISITLEFPQEVGYTNPLINAVENIMLKSMTVEILSPSNLDFSFLDDITIYITAPGLPDANLAHLYNIPANPGSSINLIPYGNVLDNYVKRNDYNMKIKVKADQIMSIDVKVKASLVLEVTLINEK